MLILSLLLASASEDGLHRATWRRVEVQQLLATGSDRDPQLLLALGRLRDPEALPVLSARVRDTDPEVATAAAFALGLIPGSRGAILEALATTHRDGSELRGEHDLRWQLIEGLGRQGTVADRDRLEKLTRTAWPDDEAASRALLRLHRRGIDVRPALPALIGVLDHDPRAGIAAAQGIVRIGLGTLEPHLLERLRHHAGTHPSTTVRADLTLALARVDVRSADLERAALDLPLVRQAVLRSLATPDAPPGELLPLLERSLHSPDAWVRTPAIQAAPVELLEDLQPSGPWEWAAIEARTRAEVPPDAPWQVRAAALPGERSVLVERALDGAEHPGVRSAAVAMLAGLQPDPSVWVELLASPDAEIRAAAFGELPDRPRGDQLAEVVLALRVETAVTAIRAGLGTLRRWRPQLIRSRYLDQILARHSKARDPSIRALARELADELGVPYDVPPEGVRTEHVDPDGTVTTRIDGWPLASEVRPAFATVHTDRGDLVIRLDPDVAPLAVHTFVSLAEEGFYDDLAWHRIVPGFVAQAGCPRGDGWGGPGFEIPDEVSDRPFQLGAVGFARAERDSAGSQFFVTLGPARFLDGDYTWFGALVEGWDVARRLELGDRITSIEVEERR